MYFFQWNASDFFRNQQSVVLIEKSRSSAKVYHTQAYNISSLCSICWLTGFQIWTQMETCCYLAVLLYIFQLSGANFTKDFCRSIFCVGFRYFVSSRNQKAFSGKKTTKSGTLPYISVAQSRHNSQIFQISEHVATGRKDFPVTSRKLTKPKLALPTPSRLSRSHN